MKVLEAGSALDRETWLAAWRRCGREPFAHPDFVALFAADGEIACAVVDDQAGGQQVLLPLVRRPVPGTLTKSTGDGWSDAISPYGFGGPYASGDVDWHDFYGGLLSWMREEQVLTAFVRADLGHPAPGWDDLPGCRAPALSESVVVDLARDRDAQWRHYAHKVRKNVNKAERAGLVCRVSQGFADLDAFVDVYRSTMDRRGAAARYYFDRAFFERLDALQGCVVVADVLDGDRVVSTELVLRSEHRLYSFLGGTLVEAYAHSPNDLLKHAVIDYGRQAGLRSYVLGGGYEPGDGIFRYKRGFDVDGVVPFHGVQLVADSDVYAAASPSGAAASGFFPAYRAVQVADPVDERA